MYNYKLDFRVFCSLNNYSSFERTLKGIYKNLSRKGDVVVEQDITWLYNFK